MQTPRPPWNKGSAVGQKKPLNPKQVRAIAHYLSTTEQHRNTALFMLAVDTMFRSVDLLKLRVSTVTDKFGIAQEQFAILQQKTGRPVVARLEQATIKALQRWVDVTQKSQSDYIFTGLTPATKHKPITTSHYRTLIKSWVDYIGLDPAPYSSHSLRRTKASLVYKATKDPETVRILLGQASIATTAVYLGIETNNALEIAEKVRLFDQPNKEVLPCPHSK